MADNELFPRTIILEVQQLDTSRLPDEQLHPRLAARRHATRGVLTRAESDSEDGIVLHMMEGGAAGHGAVFSAINAQASMVPIAEGSTHFLARYPTGAEEMHIGVNYSLGDVSMPFIALYVRNVAPSFALERFADRLTGHIGQYALDKELAHNEARRPRFYSTISIGNEDTVHATYDLSDARRMQRR